MFAPASSGRAAFGSGAWTRPRYEANAKKRGRWPWPPVISFVSWWEKKWFCWMLRKKNTLGEWWPAFRLADGRDLAKALIETGHARSYDVGKREAWCPEAGPGSGSRELPHAMMRFSNLLNSRMSKKKLGYADLTWSRAPAETKTGSIGSPWAALFSYAE